MRIKRFPLYKSFQLIFYFTFQDALLPGFNLSGVDWCTASLVTEPNISTSTACISNSSLYQLLRDLSKNSYKLGQVEKEEPTRKFVTAPLKFKMQIILTQVYKTHRSTSIIECFWYFNVEYNELTTLTVEL